MQNNDIEPISYIIPYTKKIKSIWIKNLSVRVRTIKFLKKKTRKKLHDVAFGNDFLDTRPKAQATKRYIIN